MNNDDDKVALFDLDRSLADYDSSMAEEMRRLQGPDEAPYAPRTSDVEELPHLRARRKLIQRQPGFWRGLKPLELGFDVFRVAVSIGFTPLVLTKGPTSAPNAWSEKLEWCQQHLQGVTVTVAGDKSLVYGRVLFDDYPPYFERWLARWPRGLVVCLAQSSNVDYAPGGSKVHPQVLRYDGVNYAALCARLQRAYDRRPTTVQTTA